MARIKDQYPPDNIVEYNEFTIFEYDNDRADLGELGIQGY